MRDTPDPEFFDLDNLIEAGKKHLSDAMLSDDQRKLLAEVVRGAERLRAGQSSENTKDEDE